MNKERLFWDKEYENYLCIWEDRPSESAIIAVKYLKSYQFEDKEIGIQAKGIYANRVRI